ncbi:MAG: MBL fold metallo-hydrolase [Treponema sp.]|nr:MBL fold metallo-hydrolase [Treponema sp.]
MKLRFWGVRGSIPTPLSPARLKSKISAITGRMRDSDLSSASAKEKFLAGLPDYLFSTVGGNTACVEVSVDDEHRIIFDAGTGIRELGLEIQATKKPADCHIFFSHFHWDHIQGLPYFAPAFDRENSLHFYSPRDDFREILEAQMRDPYFPIDMSAMQAPLEFVVLREAAARIGSASVKHRPMRHPGGCHSYLVEAGGVKVVYSTDTELDPADFVKTPENTQYFGALDALIIDAQYTLGDAIERNNWGHSSFSLASDFAAIWGIRRLILFHHEPNYSDRKIDLLLRNAAAYLDHLEARGIEVVLAREGLELDIRP